ncbi:MAG TPA: hypothetical protein PKG74_03145 [Candidatus Colwellbacteria bacterium]|nr:hypothetical protein [Candidatus Colwellbacteria bacterium]
MKKRRILFPVLLIWHDRTIDVKGASSLLFTWAFIRKGRTLTLQDIDEENFTMESLFTMDIRGSIRVARKPKEVSVDSLRKIINQQKNDGDKIENPQARQPGDH